MIADVIPIIRLPRNVSGTYSYNVPLDLAETVKPGTIVSIPFRNRTVAGLVKTVNEPAKMDDLKSIIANQSNAPIVTPEQMRIAVWIANTYSVSLSTSTKLIVPEIPKKLEINIKNPTRKKRVTKKSSNKTEIISFADTKKVDSIIMETVSRGRQALYIAPEKIETRRIANKYASKVENISIWRESAAKKKAFREYLKVLLGETNLIIGTRSSLFAPFFNLKLIIMENESSGSYKSESSPKYHAREVANMLSEIHNAKVIHITDTPSVETYLNDKVSGKRVKTPQRSISVVDMKEERLKGNYSNISEQLQKAVEESIRHEKNVFLFLNRRGHSSSVTCKDCGHTILCPECDLPLVFHVNKRLICHHCRHREELPPLCPSCFGPEIKLTGKGTQKIENEIAKLFPKINITRLDSDTKQTSNQIKKSKPGIFIGTEFALPRIDWNSIETVGIINADQALCRPDFRAGESTYKTLKRFLSPNLIIQTYNPDNVVIKSIAQNKPDLFYNHEIKLRRTLGYPPFTTILKLTYKNKDEKRAVGEAMHMYNRLKKYLPKEKSENIEISRPFPSYRKRVRGNYQFNLIIKIKRDNREESALSKINELITEPGWVFDRNPESLL